MIRLSVHIDEESQMSIQNAIQLTVKTIEGTIGLVKASARALINGTIYGLTHLPEVLSATLQGMWFVMHNSFTLGIFLGSLAFRLLKYTLMNLPEIAKGLYELGTLLLQNLPEGMKFCFYTMPKFFLYELPKHAAKFIYNHFPAVVRWLFNTLPDIIASGIGMTLGLLFAPFKIAYDQIFAADQIDNGTRIAPSRAQEEQALGNDLLAVAVAGVVVADTVVQDVLDTEQKMQTAAFNQQQTGTTDRSATLSASSSGLDQESEQRLTKKR